MMTHLAGRPFGHRSSEVRCTASRIEYCLTTGAAACTGWFADPIRCLRLVLPRAYPHDNEVSHRDLPGMSRGMFESSASPSRAPSNAGR